MELLKMYWKQRKGGIGLFLLCTLLFLATFFYGLPLGAVLYPAALCGVLSALFFLWDLWKVGKKHRKLMELARLPGQLMEQLPAVQTQDDADYQAVIAALRREQNQLRTDLSLRYQDMVDYYTIWAHQIKTPIAAMGLTLQKEDTALSRQLTEELRRIEQYVEMVLAFLRLGSSSRDYVFRELEVDAMVREAVKKFAGPFIRKKIHLCYQPIHRKVLTDEKWLTFVLEQVLSNAIKYTNQGSVTITWEEPETLCIRDTGIGIAPEDLPRVFEKGFTGYNGRTDKKASGIGLYLCRRILRALNHDIEINSAPGAGTVVRIRLQTRQGRLE